MADRKQIAAMLATLELDELKIVAIMNIGGVTSSSRMANMRDKEVSDLVKVLSS